MSKNSNRVQDPIPKSQGRGRIETNIDYSSNLKSRRSRILFLVLCILPYIGICTLIYLEGLELLAVILLAIPLVLLGVFWFIQKAIEP